MAKWQLAVITGCLTLLVTLTGILEPLERALLGLRFSLDHRPASGELVVVQIDAITLRELGVWPFPRAHHGTVVDKLREAGASAIAFDIELSRGKSDEDNAALVRALKDAGGQVILPSFIQLASAGQNSGETIRTEPDAQFLEHAWVANVNVYPSDDGRIWTMTYGEQIDETYQYALAATLAGRANRAGGSFYVDYGIDLATIPRISYIDLLNGNFDTAAVRGKRVIIGGTAVELGDQLNLPTIGIVSGPVLQALSFETIFQNREIHRTSIFVTLTLVLLSLLLLAWAGGKASLDVYIGCVVLFTVGLQVAAFALQDFMAVSLDTAPILFAATIMGIGVTKSELEARRKQVEKERQEKENHGRMLDQVIQDSFDGVIIVDHALRVLAINNAARTVFEIEPEAVLIGKRFTKAVPRWNEIKGTILDTVPFQQLGVLHEVALADNSDELRTYEFVITQSDFQDPLVETEETSPIFTITVRDVSERRQVERDRDTALEEATAANRAKTEFLANMSHELRTPLNAIIGFSEVMAGQMFGPLGSDQYVGYANDIEASGRHLLSVVNDILDVSRVETGDFTLNEDEISVADILESVARLANGWPMAQDRNIIVEPPNDVPLLWADERLTKQMVLNLLSNAVKFSSDGSSITLRAQSLLDGGIGIQVVDEGVGIPADCLPRLTEAFYQVDSSLERQFEGSGLGLTLVQKHMALHGGTLSFESQVGVGTTATLSFPQERTCSDASLNQPA